MRVTETHIVKIEGIDNVLYRTETGYYVGANVIGISAEEAARHMGIIPGLPRFKFDYEACKKAGLLGKTVTQLQIDSIEAILNECKKEGVVLKSQVAYILATAAHEGYDWDGKSTGTIQRFVPIREKGSETYLKGKPYYPYFGRGYVQCTWGSNYKKQGDRLGIDFMENPDRLLEVHIAANVLVNGMQEGEFTGKKLSHFLTADKTNFKGARGIVNGSDKAELIAGYAEKLMNCLSL